MPKPTFTLDQLGAIASEYGLTLIVENAEVFKKYLESLEVPKLIEEASPHPDDIL